MECRMHSTKYVATAYLHRRSIEIQHNYNEYVKTNRIFVPHDITSFPEWIETRQPAGRSTTKIHRLEQVRNVYKMIFSSCWNLSRRVDVTTTYLVISLLSCERAERSIYNLEVAFVPIGYRDVVFSMRGAECVPYTPTRCFNYLDRKEIITHQAKREEMRI